MASALSSTAWITSSRSVLVTARMASTSLASSRPSRSRSVVVMAQCSFGGQVDGAVGPEGADQLGDEIAPRGGLGEVQGQRLEAQHPEAHGVAETDEGQRVQALVDGAVELGLLDEGGHT